MTAGPASPGVTECSYQPAGASPSRGGTSTVPSLLSPSRIRRGGTPIDGMSSRTGTDFVLLAVSGGFAPVLPDDVVDGRATTVSVRAGMSSAVASATPRAV